MKNRDVYEPDKPIKRFGIKYPSTKEFYDVDLSLFKERPIKVHINFDQQVARKTNYSSCMVNSSIDSMKVAKGLDSLHSKQSTCLNLFDVEVGRDDKYIYVRPPSRGPSDIFSPRALSEARNNNTSFLSLLPKNTKISKIYDTGYLKKKMSEST